MCAACVAKVKPALDAAPFITTWEVNTTTPEKKLTVVTDAPTAKLAEILASVGYKILAEL
jgi:hypothetical protein